MTVGSAHPFSIITLPQNDPYETLILVAMPPELGNDVGVMRHDGSLRLVTDRLSVGTKELLASEAVRVSAVEASTSIDGGAKSPAAIAPRVDGLRIARKSLTMAPTVDPSGYSLVVDQSNKLPKVVRLTSLEAKPGRWLDLGGCL